MADKYKKERDEMNRRIYRSKTLQKLKEIGKKQGLLNVDQYKSSQKNILIERLIKGPQLSDRSRDQLIETAKKNQILANASMSKETLLRKLLKPRLEDYNDDRLRQIAEKEGIRLKEQMTKKDIVERLKNPTKHQTIQDLKKIARDNNIRILKNMKKDEIKRILENANLITTTPIKVEEQNLGVMISNVPKKLLKAIKTKARNAKEALVNYQTYIKHLKNESITSSRLKKLTRALEKKEKAYKEEYERIFTPRKELSAFGNFMDQYVIDGSDIYDARSFLREAKNIIINILETNRNIKARLYLNCIMVREKNGVEERAKFYFHSKLKLILENTILEEIFDEMIDEIEEAIQKTENAEGTGWKLESIIDIKLYTAEWIPLNASSYIGLPIYLKNKKAIINMKNENDNKCFLWSVLRALNPIPKNKERIDKDLISKENTLNMKGIKYPVSIKDIKKFEKQNPTISITVLAYNEKDKVYPLRCSEYTGCELDIVFLLIRNGENSHYCLVNNLSALLSTQLSKKEHKRHFCLQCLNSFSCGKSLTEHKEYCYAHKCVKIKMPEKGSQLFFKNFYKGQWVPFIIYADMESLLTPIQSCDPSPLGSYTNKTQKHKPISFSYYIKCFDDNVYESRLRTYTKTTADKEEAMDVFVKWLELDVKEIANIPKVDIVFTEEDKKQFKSETECWLCREPLNGDKVRDHCHYTGKYRGAAHNSCNLKYRKPQFVPVVFHNLANYDSHLFIKNLSDTSGNINCIPTNKEKYISFTKKIKTGEYKDKKTGEMKDKNFDIRFIDSFKFMSTSLDNLVNNLPKNAFNNLERYYSGEELDLVKRKGVYPYEYMDTEDKLEKTKLPPKEAFNSKLSGNSITNEDYNHALNVWNQFNMKTFKDYHELYNETDVLLLADVFENFRNICMENYKLDPAHYFTAPGLAWDACLKMTGIKLELLTDIDLFLMIEKGIRGGVSIISNRYGKANNKYMGKKFEKGEPSKYLQYLDANNLYGAAMSMKLPTEGFKWMSKGELETLFQQQESNTWNRNPCILEVDLEYPKELHDLHSDYPLAPERLVCENNVEKLIPNLRDKKKYVVHYKNLIQYIGLGMKLTRIHRGIKFKESEWLKSYIDLNTKLRTQAKNNFEKGFFKLMNNSVFGKTMENMRNRVDVKLVNNRNQARKLLAKPNFEHYQIFKEDFAAIQMKKTSLTMVKPIYLGMSILDLSKTIMYDFHYNYIKTKYEDHAKLLFTDTDSLMYEIKTEDFYNDISEDVKDRFDTSDYPVNHPSGIPTGCNKKVLGMFKDEVIGKCIEEFVGLRAKLYSFKMCEGKESKKCKGIKKSVVQKSISHEDYRNCLFTGKAQLRKQTMIRSYKHEVVTEEVNKVALDAEDRKRYILEDGVHTLAWGHHKIDG